MDSIAEKEILSDADTFSDELIANEEDKPQRLTPIRRKKLKNIIAGKQKHTTDSLAVALNISMT